MSSFAASVVDAVRQPDYTGANRCWPCTAVNVGIALALAVGVAVASVPIAGVAILLVALGGHRGGGPGRHGPRRVGSIGLRPRPR